MSKKFLRESFVTILETPIGKPTTVLKQWWGYDQKKNTNVPTGLRITFTISKQLTDVADTATVRIYNLNRESRKLLAQRSIYLYKTAQVRTLQIQAGYADALGALFNGGIERVTNTRQGPDWITEIKASSALSQILHNVYDKNWHSDAGTSAKTIFEEVATAAGVGDVAYSPAALDLLTKTKLPSFSASGNAYETVRKLVKSMGLVFTVDNGKTIVVEPSAPLTDPSDLNAAFRVSEFTGLVGSPRVEDMGYEFRVLIDHNITMGLLVLVESQTLEESTPGLDAMATVWTMEIRGDTHEDDWYMDVKTLFYPPQVSPLLNMGQQPPTQGDITP